MIDLKKLCIEIATTEDGDDVKAILENYSLWNDRSCWKAVGSKGDDDKNLNNFSIIGSQQSNPVNALVEKLVNCGDSALILRCQEEGISLQGNDTPENIKIAMEKLLDVEDGRWINAVASTKTALAEKYCNFVATGEVGKNANPTYTIIDNCEGQHPSQFQSTFMSLTQKNKVGIKFVQGKFGMGSYGAVNFCTKYGLQLIISKRNPKLNKTNLSDEWGFTVVRKIEPTVEDRCSQWQYLVINNEVPSFKKEDLEIYPGKYPNIYGGEFKYGSFIKLYNYDIGPALRTNITLDLYNRINTLLVNPVVPIRFHERRKFTANSYETTLDGLETRLERDRSGVLEDNFPSEFIFNIEGQKFIGNIYAFKKYSNEEKKIKVDTKNYGDGVIFTINGQSNGNLPRRFFSTGGLKYETISKNLLVTVDCSNVEPRFIEQIFQNNRERIYDKTFTKKIKEAIKEELENHQGLRKFQNNWRSSEIRELKNSEKTQNLFEKLMSKNPNLSNYLFKGGKIINPFNKQKKEEERKYVYEFFPTFFQTTKPHLKDSPRIVEKERNIRVSLETNAPNDYFTRPREPGSFKVYKFGEDITNNDGVKLSGFNGEWNLSLPESKDEFQQYRFEVTDNKKLEPLTCEFYLKLEDKRERKKHPSNKNQKSNQLKMPDVIPLNREHFQDNEIDEKDILFIEDTYDGHKFYLNMDNVFVASYLKKLSQSEGELAKEQYRISATLLGLVLIEEFKNKKKSSDEDDKENGTLKDFSREYTRSLAPIYMDFIRDISSIISK